MSCSCRAAVVFLSHRCRVPVALLSCSCRAAVVFLSHRCVFLSRRCRVPVGFLSCCCRVPVALLSRRCRVPVAPLSCSCRVPVALLSCSCRAIAGRTESINWCKSVPCLKKHRRGLFLNWIRCSSSTTFELESAVVVVQWNFIAIEFCTPVKRHYELGLNPRLSG